MLRTLTICACLLVGTGLAVAEDWPQRPVRFIVPFAAGGGTDIVARVLAQRLGDTLGQPFVVENKPGASGMIGAQAVAKGDADGHVFLIGSPAEIALNQHLFAKMSYAPETDLVPITLLAWTPLVLAAHPSLEVDTPAQLITLARARSVDFSSPGIGSAHHLTGEYMKKLQSLQLVHVPYRGASNAVTDAVAGQVKLTISGMPPVVPFLQGGQLKAIAVTSKRRAPMFPGIPALAETPGFEDFDFTNWFGLMARAGTPPFILERISKAAVIALKDEKLRAVLAQQAAEPVGNTPAEFHQFVREESAKYAKIVKLTGVQVK